MDPHVELFQHLGRNQTIRRIIVDDEQSQPATKLRDPAPKIIEDPLVVLVHAQRRLVGDRQRQAEADDGALAGHRNHLYLAAHPFDQSLADG
jgi:hypothetical protein